MTEHEDIELGRCVLHHTGVGCTKSYEMGTLFKNNYNVEETDSEGLKPVFEEVAGHSGMVFTGSIVIFKMTEIEWPPNMKIPGPTMTVHFLF